MPSSTSVPTRIASLRRLLAAHDAAIPGGPRAALERSLRGENALAIAEARRLYDLLAKQDAWLWHNGDHPKHDEREGTYCATLAEYEALSDLIGAAASRLGVAIPEATAWACRGEAFAAWRDAYRATVEGGV